MTVRAPQIRREGRATVLTSDVEKRSAGRVTLDKKTGKARLANPRRPSRSVASAGQFSEKQLAVMFRIRELLRSERRRSIHCIDERAWVYPRYGRAITQEWADYETRTGDYFGLSTEDRARRFWAVMEGICDHSNAIPSLPKWWTK